MGLIESPPFHGPELVELESPEGIFSGVEAVGARCSREGKGNGQGETQNGQGCQETEPKSKR